MELEDLDALIKSPGWVRFVAYVNGEWGSDGVLFQNAITAAANVADDPIATAKLRQVLVTQREVKKLIAWLPARIAQLRATALSPGSDAVATQARGGY